MDEHKIENGNSEIPEVEDLVIEEGDDAETVRTKTADWKQKVEDRNKQLFARTKKAEGFEPDGNGGWKKSEAKPKEEIKGTSENSKDSLTSADVFTLVKNDVPEEDIDEVLEYAKFKKISVAEALKSSVVKTMLADKAEQRKVNEGTSTSGGRQSNARISDESLMANARKGVMPESEADLTRLFKLRKGIK